MRRCRRGHPWMFVLTAGTMVAALVAGDFGQAAVLALLALFLLRG